MAPRRVLALEGPTVTLVVDGEDVAARDGEPVAHAILASGRWVFGRSVKYHRARGPVCFRGRCEGCLLRVDGVSSVMTCRTAARHGMRCESQNVVGSARHDLLAVTDFLFPEGLDHHEMFTWNKPVNRAMQIVAREIAGVGTLPDSPEPPQPVRRRDAEVLVIGAGLSGLTVARRVAAGGLSTLVLEEEPSLAPHVAELAAAARLAGAEVLTGMGALGVFTETDGRRIVLADASDGGSAMSICAGVLVCALGSAETGHAFEGNDLPGVVTAAAAERLLDGGILVGEDVVLAAHPTEEAIASRVSARLSAAGARVHRMELAALRRARGRTGVTSIDTSTGQRRCDALVLASIRGPVTELPQQAGAKVRFDGERFTIVASAGDGSTAHPDTFVVGSAVSVDDVVAQAERAAAAILSRGRGGRA